MDVHGPVSEIYSHTFRFSVSRYALHFLFRDNASVLLSIEKNEVVVPTVSSILITLSLFSILSDRRASYAGGNVRSRSYFSLYYSLHF